MDAQESDLGPVAMRTSCRACDSENLFVGIDLGDQPLAGGFIREVDSAPLYENKMLVCSDCGLGQLSKDADPVELYADYNWRTSTSVSYLTYIWEFAYESILPYLDKEDWVLEIASNDGYLLKYLKDRGIDVLGVDPAENISMYAIANGVPVITDFFSADLAKKIVALKGHPKWIIANNVAAHTPELQSFIEGISILSGPDTVVTIENPTIMNILDQDKQHFDVIFHEHYSYLSANAVHKIAKRYGMTLFNLDKTPPQGGSNRYWLHRQRVEVASARVQVVLDQELASGLTDPKAWSTAQSQIEAKAINFATKIRWLKDSGAVICGVGASAKSTVTLNFAQIRAGDISAVADDVLEKQGFYIPGPHIPITPMSDMLALDPTDIIIFAWNIKEELEHKLRGLGYTGRTWAWNDI